MTKYCNKYRIESFRLQNRDYGANGYYYVTIKTKMGNHYFGYVEDDQMHLNELGEIAKKCWKEIPEHYPFVILDEFVVMPNHVHGIIIINKINIDESVETQNFASLQNRETKTKPKNKFGPQSQNLAAIIRGFKIGVTKYAKQNNIPFNWHPRFHDRVLRMENNELALKRYYIKNNPSQWRKSNTA
jgi:REP element-mobilizing transposase RayT